MATANSLKVRAVGLVEIIPVAGYTLAAYAMLATDALSGGILSFLGGGAGVCAALKFFSAGRKLYDPDYFNRSFMSSPALFHWGILAPLYRMWPPGPQTRSAHDAANTPAIS